MMRMNRSSSLFPAVMSALANLLDDQMGASTPPHLHTSTQTTSCDGSDALCIAIPFIPDLTYPFSGVF